MLADRDLRRDHARDDTRSAGRLGTDYFGLRDELTEAERDYLERTRDVRRQRGAACHQRLLGARRVPVGAHQEDGRARHRRRRHRRLRVPADEPGRRRTDQHGAEPRRRQPRHLPGRPGRAGHAVHLDARLRGAEAALAAGHGPARPARRVRADRGRPRLGRRRSGDDGDTGGGRIPPGRGEALDRQRHDR